MCVLDKHVTRRWMEKACMTETASKKDGQAWLQRRRTLRRQVLFITCLFLFLCLNKTNNQPTKALMDGEPTLRCWRACFQDVSLFTSFIYYFNICACANFICLGGTS